jgi:hypothetical protein
MSNEKIKTMINDRIDIGAKKYGDHIDVNDGRDWLQETLEELLDGIVYAVCELLKIKENRDVKLKSVIRQGKEKGEKVEQEINGAECEEISRRSRDKIVTKEGWTYTGEGSSRGHKYFVGETMACGGDDEE